MLGGRNAPVLSGKFVISVRCKRLFWLGEGPGCVWEDAGYYAEETFELEKLLRRVSDWIEGSTCFEDMVQSDMLVSRQTPGLPLGWQTLEDGCEIPNNANWILMEELLKQPWISRQFRIPSIIRISI